RPVHLLLEISQSKPVLERRVVRPAFHSFRSQLNRVSQSSSLYIAEHEPPISSKTLRSELTRSLKLGNRGRIVSFIQRSLSLLNQAACTGYVLRLRPVEVQAKNKWQQQCSGHRLPHRSE